MTSLVVNDITIGFYPDEGDAGGRKSYLSDLNSALASSSSSSGNTPPFAINVVGWYAQTYPHETFDGFQLMPLVDDLKREFDRCDRRANLIYEASVMPFQSWQGYTPDNDVKAKEVAQVMQNMLDRSRVGEDANAEFAIAEIRLRFGHEVNYYIKSGLYPPPTNTADPGWDYRAAFDQVAIACRALPPQYASRIKMFWCPNIASTSSGADAEYKTFLPTLHHIDYVGIDYYCPAPGCLDPSDFVRKMKKVHDRYASAERPFILGETGLHFDVEQGVDLQQVRLRWLDVVTGREAKKGLKWMTGVSWFNYEKDRDYRVVDLDTGERNAAIIEWLQQRVSVAKSNVDGGGAKAKVKGFWKTLLAK
ncbi:glycoside hydrolase [Pseudozyma hubeiensis SY62]|uniref:Glycoside hydrolase n=1 Tax=Pseudozyma hubeiensis (strain SY62) TaxID=1305764 RepID=R9PJT0_PSEHS|nr:glycoside hydrolase [Pseudozyma hubeiensis SY62]GAC98335.1 glycoside hydrolase [Pseudozyma hubeiensis SY62]